jgi:hypothetical protein
VILLRWTLFIAGLPLSVFLSSFMPSAVAGLLGGVFSIVAWEAFDE